MAELTVHLTEEVTLRLDELSARTGQPRPLLAARAIDAFFDREIWQLEEIAAGLEEANRNDFAHPDDVRTIVQKHTQGTLR